MRIRKIIIYVKQKIKCYLHIKTKLSFQQKIKQEKFLGNFII